MAMTDQATLTSNPKAELSATVPRADASADKVTVTDPPSTEGRRRSWLTDTLHAIVERALTADKPDIKGALAALAMLAETDETTTASDDIATVIRDARRRAHDAASRQ